MIDFFSAEDLPFLFNKNDTLIHNKNNKNNNIKINKISRELFDPMLFLKKMKKMKNDSLSKSGEAYFNNSTVVIESERLITELKSVVSSIDSDYDKFKRDSTSINLIGNYINQLNALFEKELNVEEFNLILGFKQDSYDAFSIPMCWQKYEDEVDAKRSGFKNNKEFILSLEDIVETSNGYKFKNPKGKLMLVAIGIDIIRDFEVKEIQAIIFHEIGHGFQQIVGGISENILLGNIRSIFIYLFQSTSIYSLVILITAFSGTIIVFLNQISEAFGIKNYMKKIFDYLNMNKENRDENVPNNSKNLSISNSRKQIFDAIYKENRIEMNKEENYEKSSIVVKVIMSFILFIINTLSAPLQLIFYSIYAFYGNIINLISENIIFGKDKEKIKERATLYESFADLFSSSYGLGKYLASALNKLTKSKNYNLGLFSFLDFFPFSILTITYKFGKYSYIKKSQFAYGYRNNTERISDIYNDLQKEINTNKDLTAEQRNEILEHLRDIENTYNELNKKKYGIIVGFVRSLYVKKIDNLESKKVVEELFKYTSELPKTEIVETINDLDVDENMKKQVKDSIDAVDNKDEKQKTNIILKTINMITSLFVKNKSELDKFKKNKNI